MTGCTKELLDRIGAEGAEGLDIHKDLTGTMQDPACKVLRRLLLRLSGKWAEGFSIVVLNGQSVTRERFLAAY